MLEDKLSRDERRRLECLAQAIASSRDPDPDQILARARQYDSYVRDQEATAPDPLAAPTPNLAGVAEIFGRALRDELRRQAQRG